MEEEPHGCTVTHNVIEDFGLILKHVSGVALTAARGNLVAYNRIQRSPRFGNSPSCLVGIGLDTILQNDPMSPPARSG